MNSSMRGVADTTLHEKIPCVQATLDHMPGEFLSGLYARVEAWTARETRLLCRYSRIYGTLHGGVSIVERVRHSETNRQVLGIHAFCSLYPVQLSCNSPPPESWLILASLSRKRLRIASEMLRDGRPSGTSTAVNEYLIPAFRRIISVPPL